MRKSRSSYFKVARASWRASLVTFVTVIFLALPLAFADDSTQQVFQTPQAAASALVGAAKTDNLTALSSILGPDGRQIISSGDPVADNNAREEFVRRYGQMHRLAYDDEGRVVLYIGADNWPTPIPLVRKDGGWIFATAAGKEELLYRRIGRNELFTIDVLRNLVDAEHEYAANRNQFAQKILSTPGQQNGLYWKSAEGEPESPIGPLVADATLEGYRRSDNSTPPPFHGYYYKVLTRQGRNAPGGAMKYIVDGQMTKGFAFLAYPAEYRSSGVMTFMVNQDGIIVQKDLGPETVKRASELTEFNPDGTWDQVIEDTDEPDSN
jgi:Protein of unknown function (DUF2950)